MTLVMSENGGVFYLDDALVETSLLSKVYMRGLTIPASIVPLCLSMWNVSFHTGLISGTKMLETG